MAEWIKDISEVFGLFPDYIGEGVMELLIMVVGGIIVGYITSKYLYRINELNKVKGWMLEKRIPIYEDLFRQTEEMMLMIQVAPEMHDKAVRVLEKHHLPSGGPRQVSVVFTEAGGPESIFLQFDGFASQNSLFLDPQTNRDVSLLQNYLAAIHRMTVLFDEQMILYKVSGNEKVKKVRSFFLLTLGTCLSSELLELVMSTQDTIRASISHLELSSRDGGKHSGQYSKDIKQYVEERITELTAFEERESIQAMITEFVAMGLVAGGCTHLSDIHN